MKKRTIQELLDKLEPRLQQQRRDFEQALFGFRHYWIECNWLVRNLIGGACDWSPRIKGFFDRDEARKLEVLKARAVKSAGYLDDRARAARRTKQRLERMLWDFTRFRLYADIDPTCVKLKQMIESHPDFQQGLALVDSCRMRIASS